jgi:hypothetical protein
MVVYPHPQMEFLNLLLFGRYLSWHYLVGLSWDPGAFSENSDISCIITTICSYTRCIIGVSIISDMGMELLLNLDSSRNAGMSHEYNILEPMLPCEI